MTARWVPLEEARDAVLAGRAAQSRSGRGRARRVRGARAGVAHAPPCGRARGRSTRPCATGVRGAHSSRAARSGPVARRGPAA